MRTLKKSEFRFVWRKADAVHTWHAKVVSANTPSEAIRLFTQHLKKGPAKASLGTVVVDHLFLRGTGTEDVVQLSLRSYAHSLPYVYDNVVYPAPL